MTTPKDPPDDSDNAPSELSDDALEASTGYSAGELSDADWLRKQLADESIWARTAEERAQKKRMMLLNLLQLIDLQLKAVPEGKRMPYLTTLLSNIRKEFDL